MEAALAEARAALQLARAQSLPSDRMLPIDAHWPKGVTVQPAQNCTWAILFVAVPPMML